MTNLQLARFLSMLAWQLACMIILGVSGNSEGAKECEEDFWELMELLDELEGGSKDDA